jgi:4-aminobutyrate aminotransferase/(S)-3-amino-2-methylpropionate transaminase
MMVDSTPAIRVNTEIPGPKAQAILARREAAVVRGLGRSTPVVAAKAHGALVEDVDGNVFIDFAGGIGTLAVGHTPQSVVDAIQQQTADLIHLCAIVGTYESYIELCELLNQIIPGNFRKKTILSNVGAEAVENAIRCARSYTGRPGILCFEGAYHGRTLLTMTLTSKYDLFKKGFGPFASDVYRIGFPYMYRRPPQMTEEEFTDWCIQSFDYALTAQVDPSALAAVILEPVIGEGGFIPTPPRYFAHIAKRCKEHGIVLIADEVQTGFGRTGKMFASEHYAPFGVEPDLIITAKSMGAGMPISAVTGRAEIMDAPHPGGIGGTYGGNPITCVAAIETIKLLREQNMPERAMDLGELIQERMMHWKETIEIVGDVRGLGSMLAIELVLDRQTKAPAKNETLAVIQEAARNGLILIRAGLYSNCIRMLIPLMIPEAQLHEGLDVLEKSLKKINQTVHGAKG